MSAVIRFGTDGWRAVIGEDFTVTGDHAPTWNGIYGALATAAGVERPELVHVASETIAAFAPALGPTLLGDKAHSMLFDCAKVRALVPEFRTTVGFDEGARRIVAHHDAHEEHRVIDPAHDELSDRLVAFARSAA